MAEFAYNNHKNISTNYSSFKLNCDFYSQMFYKKDVDFFFKWKAIDELAAKLKQLTNLS